MNLPVQGNLEYHDHICIRWKVDCALNFVSSESQTVTFRKSDVNLRLIQPSAFPVLIMQMKSNPVLEGVYEIEAFILDKNNKKIHRKTKFFTFISPHYGEVWSVERKLVHSTKDALATNDVFNFVCIINFSSHRCLEKQLDVAEPPDSSLEKLSCDISRLYKSSEHSDVLLKCDGSRIPAHQFLLSARSDVFAAMFKSDMIESQQGVIDIQDIELPVLDHLLKYMYSGKMDEVTADTAVGLYRAADRYCMSSLQRKCASVITRELTTDNACEVLVLADAHSDQVLKNCVLSYLQRDEEFLLSEQWRTFSKMHPNLAVEAYDAYIRRLSHK